MTHVNTLQGAELDYWVARADGHEPTLHPYGPHTRGFTCKAHVTLPGVLVYSPSERWDQGGPIIERERIQLWDLGSTEWAAKVNKIAGNLGSGPTPLIAAMRAFVADRFGDFVGDDE